MVTAMKQRWIILIILYLIREVIPASITGTIEDDISFYYQELPVQPSMLATVVFSISYPSSNEYVDFQLYTTSNHVNIHKRCSFQRFSQVRNIHLYDNLSRTECGDINGTSYCRKIRMIQDYVPRKLSFSLGFDCDEASEKSLKSTKCTVDVSVQKNETVCLAMPDTYSNSSKFHSLVSYPNLLGHSRDDAFVELKDIYRRLREIQLPFNCYTHLEELFCSIFFPRCDPELQSSIAPCREMYGELENGCFSVSFLYEILTATPINTEYLPLRDGNIPCFYKPVICRNSPNATDIGITGGLNDSGIYYGGSKLEYSCTDESLVIPGNNTVRCLYSG